MVVSRLLRSHSSFPRANLMIASSSGRLFSTDGTIVGEPLRVKEAETVEVTPPPTEKLLVLGGNGFVGSHICRAALDRGLSVSSLSRSGKSSLRDSWADSVVWNQGDLLSPDSMKHAMNGVTSVISCVGGFGSNSHMLRINGTANINAIKAAAEQGSIYLMQRATEKELLTKFPCGGVILRPGFIHGTRRIGSMKLPLSVIGAPLEMVLQHAKVLTRIPLVGPLLIPPVNVNSVAEVAVRAAIDPGFPPGIVDVYGILQHRQQNSG
ncbi:hypothetical protein CJ030_MR6G018068 [Morella rubra]|uniref:NAD(P)-binding domain-containing protein n=1 Tax=Morella rubra TaxID=262757 RepID=A0A6A1VDZ6_9ROSI|nr:hypothetical protein CJ030_MR6G018068 [Morella rubra]